MLLALALFAAADAPTTCVWIGAGAFTRPGLTRVTDCANAVGFYLLTWEPMNGGATFDGKARLSAAGHVIGRCRVRTPRAITDEDRARVSAFAWPRTSGGENPTPERLRDPDWQDILRRYLDVTCRTD